MILSEKIKYQQTVLQEYFEEIEYQNELNDRFLGMMSHMQKEFISSQHDSEEELREFKRQLSIKVHKFEAEIARARFTFAHLKQTKSEGILVPPSDTNHNQMTSDA